MVNTRKLKGKLLEEGLTQADLAEVLSLSRTTVSQKLNGIRPLFLEEAERIANTLHIPDEDFRDYFFTPNLRDANSGGANRTNTHTE